MKHQPVRTFLRASLPAVAGALLAAVPSGPAAACGDGAYTGQICMTAASYCPANTAELTGQTLPINGNEALFSLIGCTFGGDCRSTLGLPDLRGRAPVHYGTGPGLTAHPFGQSFGQESVVQTMAQLAPHSHTAEFAPSGGGGGSDVVVEVSTSPASSPSPTPGAYLASNPDFSNMYTTSPGTTVELGGVSGGGGGSSGGTVMVDATGLGNPLPTVSPRIALRYCIVLDGIYPPRP